MKIIFHIEQLKRSIASHSSILFWGCIHLSHF